VVTHSKATFPIAYGLEHLWLKLTLTQLDDDGQKFKVTYTMGPTTICRRNIVHMKGNVSSFWCYVYGSLLALVTNHWPLIVFMKVS
jgi:hypothetical protein